MKATGIVRRIDDLGRVVIPKEIRRTLRIREGDPLEIFTDREGEIVLKKYSPIGELGNFAGQYAESLAQTTGCMVCVTDRDEVIAVAGGSKRNMLAKHISKGLEKVIDERENVLAYSNDKGFVKICDDDENVYSVQAVSPIICEGDAIGAVVITSREEGARFGETEQKLCFSAASFLGRQLES